ncbi:hypothetical protein K2173_019390 [Erythroxylum novogranatense]|uniref:Uncharacterized protein n=1 Tax=Erythroxylum novogranatense TaxID=1862640 RepID=A0AAV8UEP2_9ROSI|nr:hypothetical protein K2173_019390 [Erythroxylum novogranatense]
MDNYKLTRFLRSQLLFKTLLLFSSFHVLTAINSQDCSIFSASSSSSPPPTMSQRPSRHQRRPSQSVIMSLPEDLSDPSLVGDRVSQPSAQHQPLQPPRAPLPPSSATPPPVEASENAGNKDVKGATDVGN